MTDEEILNMARGDVKAEDQLLAAVERCAQNEAFNTLRITAANATANAVTLARALLAGGEREQKLRDQVNALADAMQHGVNVARQHREARDRGGQHVGVGGELASVTPSGLGRIEWYARALHEAATLKPAPGSEGGK